MNVEGTFLCSNLLRHGFVICVTINFDVAQMAFIISKDDDFYCLAV